MSEDSKEIRREYEESNEVLQKDREAHREYLKKINRENKEKLKEYNEYMAPIWKKIDDQEKKQKDYYNKNKERIKANQKARRDAKKNSQV